MFERPAYLLFLAHAASRSRVSDYLAALPPLQEYGGHYLAVAPAASVERFGHNHNPQSLVLSRWPSLAIIQEFWQSPAHQTLDWAGAQCVQVAALEGEWNACRDGQEIDEALAIFLGPGPSPALLEAEGARALALVRQAQVTSLFGAWEQGDIAIYAWTSAQRARRQLVTFSSGQRGRSILVPALAASRKPQCYQAHEPLLLRAIA